jgi:hypothetical protein
LWRDAAQRQVGHKVQKTVEAQPQKSDSDQDLRGDSDYSHSHSLYCSGFCYRPQKSSARFTTIGSGVLLTTIQRNGVVVEGFSS